MRARLLRDPLTTMAVIAIVFVTGEWGSRGVRFGVVILLVAFISFLAGERWGRREERSSKGAP